MKVTLVGMGLGNPDHLTRAAQTALQGADCLAGSKRLLEECTLAPGVERFVSTKSAEIVEYLLNTNHETACVLYSGDTGFHSGVRTLLPLLRERGLEVEVLPGISSMQYLASKLGQPWQDWQVVSAHGLSCDPVAAVLSARGKPVFFLTGGAGGAGDLCKVLTDAGLGTLRATIGQSLSYEEEKILTGHVWEFAEKNCAPLTVLLVEGFQSPYPYCSQGIEDEAFLRDEVPMTKQEVRAAVIGKLKVQEQGIYWDIGAGTGSVAVELALQARQGQVYAVECNPIAYRLIQANRQKFGAYNLHLVEGKAPDCLANLPIPDGVFIGGTKGQLTPILDVILEKNPHAHICMTAIVLETLASAMKDLTDRGFEPQVSQISVSRSKQVGTYHMMIGQNPVFLITVHKGEKQG